MNRSIRVLKKNGFKDKRKNFLEKLQLATILWQLFSSLTIIIINVLSGMLLHLGVGYIIEPMFIHKCKYPTFHLPFSNHIKCGGNLRDYLYKIGLMKCTNSFDAILNPLRKQGPISLSSLLL